MYSMYHHNVTSWPVPACLHSCASHYHTDIHVPGTGQAGMVVPRMDTTRLLRLLLTYPGILVSAIISITNFQAQIDTRHQPAATARDVEKENGWRYFRYSCTVRCTSTRKCSMCSRNSYTVYTDQPELLSTVPGTRSLESDESPLCTHAHAPAPGPTCDVMMTAPLPYRVWR